LRGALIGTFIGILPGAGGSIASIVSYGEAKRSSKIKIILVKVSQKD